MRPKSKRQHPGLELFQVDLEQIIGLHHPLARLGMCVDWASFEEALERRIGPRAARRASRRS